MAATIKDVAEFAGVGIGTVSRVINEEKSVKPATREKVKSAMTTLQFSPNKMAAKLRKNETRIIALLVPVINHPFFAKFAYYVEDEADKFGYSTILVSSQQRVQKETDIIDRIHRREVDGAVFVTHFSHGEEELKDCPIVSIDRHFGDDMPFVTSDNYSATCRAVEYLLEKGCKHYKSLIQLPHDPLESEGKSKLMRLQTQYWYRHEQGQYPAILFQALP